MIRPRNARLQRRQFLKGAGLALAAAAAGETLYPLRRNRALAADGNDRTIRVLGISTGALADWSGFEKDTGLKMEWTPASDDVGVFLHEMIAGGAGERYDLVTCLSGSYEMLAEQDLLLPIDPMRLKHWRGVAPYVEAAVPRVPDGKGLFWSIPYHLSADSFIYWPDELKAARAPEEVSWKLIYDDPATKGRSAIDNETYALGCAAIYLKHHKIVEIGEIGNMTESECRSVADFLIERKHAGQFRALYKSFDEQVQLLTSREVLAETGWAPAALAAKQQGCAVDYAFTVEGYDKWAQNLMIPAQVKDRNALDKVYAAIDWLLGGAYAAEIMTAQGYVTARPELGLDYAREQGWPAGKIATIQTVIESSAARLSKDLYWDPGYFRNFEAYEREMARFKNA